MVFQQIFSTMQTLGRHKFESDRIGYYYAEAFLSWAGGLLFYSGGIGMT